MSEQFFHVGQRWSNTAETDLGIGIVTQVNERTVTLFFPSTEELRNYAQANAPLTRLEFQPRDMIETEDGTNYRVLTRHEEEGLYFYEAESDNGEVKILCESQVQGSSSMPEPLKRLLQGHFEHYKTFGMRLKTWELQSHYDQNPAKGFIGPRVDPIPHQFHIAQTVSRHAEARVMLADEVGLGKTIEAGLIAHQLLISGKISRIIILVPDSLVHQWLVEMRRRFNMPVRVLDNDQCEALCEQQDTDNPFMHEQLVLCSIQFLLHNQRWANAALDSPWDLLIVDEAHHLAWQPEAPSPAYSLVEEFSLKAKSLLLLTATPEKEGPESHFAQLHLLDPLRYQNLPAFIEQQARFNDIALMAERLIDHQSLSGDQLNQLKQLLQDESSLQLIEQLENDQEDSHAATTLATRLLDQHGTGRALFRNTRASISGFPQRQLTRVRLQAPELYTQLGLASFLDQLYPEMHAPEVEWLAQDPRVEWLLETLKQNRGQKFLVICHHKDSACALQAHLHFKGGIQCSAFHEDLSLIERDRSAAWFAAEEDGAQALICSEIGSEGRNFQFCHNLVMFDLPGSIDLLEQRIGRLDRIGQQEDIQIFTPYLADTQQQHLLNWYDEGFNAFTKTEASHSVVFENLQDDFHQAIIHMDNSALEQLINTTQTKIAELHERFVHGRNRLLELHSRGDDSVAPLIEAVLESDDDPSLEFYMEQVFNAYGVEEEELSENIVLIRPGTSLEHNSFPNLPEDGVSATFERDIALSREDIEFLSLDHPMVRNAMDMIITSGKGSSVMSLLKNKQIKEGTILLEALFIVECPAPAELQLGQLLPATPVRLLLDQQGRDISKAVTTDALDKQLKRVKGDLITPMLKEIQDPVLAMLNKGNSLMEQRKQALVENAQQRFRDYWENEKQRLQALSHLDQQDKAIHNVEKRLQKGLALLAKNSQYRLDGLRIMVTIS
ncbi:MAG: RNA polymerase-associated protein RapA [Pseudomonadales bacterium]|nr:RNA polymerase-associated protein RapA [Pseudomonadales bacterium]HAU15628.1 RNA polymerase-associated protein RapA [Gammaproteobacteria bacterium]|tara:strand:+ start:2736 stop:5588 length:2853 start_codon:yes stop_codon:yes gene_type:complete